MSGITGDHPAAPAVLTGADGELWPVGPPAGGETVLLEVDTAPYPAMPTVWH